MNYCLSNNCNAYDIIIIIRNFRVLNNSQLVVVLIGTLMHGVMSIAPWHLRYKICTKEMKAIENLADICVTAMC